MTFEPPWRRPTILRRSQRSEAKAAKLDGGRRVARSGAGREKGDVRSSRWRGEDKITDAASFTLKLATLKKIEHEALRTPPGLLPYLRVTMQGSTYRIMREEDVLALIDPQNCR